MIVILEDDDNIRKLVTYTLQREKFEVEGFARPSDFWKFMDKNTPELLLLDIMLPEEDGLSILQKLRQDPATRDLPIIMLTAKSSEYDKVTGLDEGADDYIAKPFGIMELVSRVRALLRRTNGGGISKEKLVTPEIFDIGTLHLDNGKHIVSVDNEEIELSLKEYSVLLLLLEAKGNVVSRDELLTQIWGEYYEESRTLDVHIRKLRVKLGSAGEYIKTVKGVGYKIEES